MGPFHTWSTSKVTMTRPAVSTCMFVTTPLNIRSARCFDTRSGIETHSARAVVVEPTSIDTASRHTTATRSMHTRRSLIDDGIHLLGDVRHGTLDVRSRGM